MEADDPTLTLARLARLLENNGTTELTLPQYRVLGLLAGGDERASHLAARLAVAKPTLTSLVDSLVERGLAARETLDGDRRVVRVSITPAGRVRAAQGGRRSAQGFRHSARSLRRSRRSARCARRAPRGTRQPLGRSCRGTVRRGAPRGGPVRVRGSTARPPHLDAAMTRPAPAGSGVGWLRRLGPFIGRYKRIAIATLILSVIAQTLIGLLPLIQQRDPRRQHHPPRPAHRTDVAARSSSPA